MNSLLPMISFQAVAGERTLLKTRTIVVVKPQRLPGRIDALVKSGCRDSPCDCGRVVSHARRADTADEDRAANRFGWELAQFLRHSAETTPRGAAKRDDSGEPAKPERPNRKGPKRRRPTPAAAPRPKARPKKAPPADARCGLCGKSEKLRRTECCGHWICDDQENYRLFSFERNSCDRNHQRLTLCASHHQEEHEGRWQDCAKCRELCEPEMVAWFGTNEYNFEKMPNPPKFRPTFCSRCHRRIVLSAESYSTGPRGYRCLECGPGER